MGYSGAGGKLIHEKNREKKSPKKYFFKTWSRKSRDTVPFTNDPNSDPGWSLKSLCTLSWESLAST